MNTEPTTTTQEPLDRFESALLDELREHVATRSAPDLPEATPMPRRHRGRRWALGVAAAAAVATVGVVVAPGGPGASPAYAVEQAADGDVVVTIHRLEDASGLERALRDHGIDAEVSFDPDSRLEEFTFTVPDGETGPPPPDEEGTVKRSDEVEATGPRLDQGGGEGRVSEAEPAEGEQMEDIDPAGCGTGQPATLRQNGADWVLRIPADSPLQDRPIQLATNPEGNLSVQYPGDQPDSYCAVESMG